MQEMCPPFGKGTMILGFTGTRQGMTLRQKNQLRFIMLMEYENVSEAHHGDCVGADAEFHHIVRPFTDMVVVHPSDLAKQRAFCEADVVLTPKPPLERNKDIVTACDMLIAAPAQDEEVVRSGTWATIREARRQGKIVRQLLR